MVKARPLLFWHACILGEITRANDQDVASAHGFNRHALMVSCLMKLRERDGVGGCSVNRATLYLSGPVVPVEKETASCNPGLRHVCRTSAWSGNYMSSALCEHTMDAVRNLRGLEFICFSTHVKELMLC